ncbi:golgin candidate 4 isoform X1 [Ziziphus jujuba]|uniref:Golgin candidate 4 isoform X1 n=1 Tax=Ziziphus jujuba TaxID=326968 RepID=A0ABM3IT48_ZIZJJ|nr:golgin candidate 4 isoform X1 [Ziziphus jujuba]
MMWGTIANLKENLNKIAHDVHDEEDDDEEFEIYGSINGREASPVSDRRNSHSFAHSKSAMRSPLANGIDSPRNPEIEQYKAEIKRLQESEAEIKTLSKNYAALLKEKEDHISRLNKENGSLRQTLDATTASLNASGSDSSKTSTNGTNALKGDDRSSNRQHKFTTQAKNRYPGNQIHNGGVSKVDGMGNGISHTAQHQNMQGKEREFADFIEENNRSQAAEMKQLRMELGKEREQLENIEMKLQEERNLNESFQGELKSLKMERDKAFSETSKLQNDLNEKISEIRRLQTELNRREDEGADDIENLKSSITTLEKENASLKTENNELVAALEACRISTDNKTLNEKISESFPGKEEMELSLQKLNNEIKEICSERDKALQELARLKQHLLEKESEESEKMDEDCKLIEELRENNEYQRAQILHLEKALKQAVASQEEVKINNNSEIQKSKELIDDLNRKLANCMRTIDAKNVELLNLQTALGQYYAEIEAKEHLEGDLARAREELARLSELLKNADHQAEVSKREKEEILSHLSQSERILADWKNRVNKLEEDNAKLRRAVEQSMTRLNRMSIDSDYLVDRRIVIKLLVTYFQRNHSKEVLDLMVRMLGFSDEDKQRIGLAQQGAGKGVVRGVLGLPGRLVGGILGGSPAEGAANMASDNQSFADLWVDFLLKENEERERRESMDDPGRSKEESFKSPKSASAGSHVQDHRASAMDTHPAPGFSRTNLSTSHNSGHFPFHSNFRQSEHSDSEFSTVPLTSSESNFNSSRRLPK